jgi:hypothetical protein
LVNSWPAYNNASDLRKQEKFHLKKNEFLHFFHRVLLMREEKYERKKKFNFGCGFIKIFYIQKHLFPSLFFLFFFHYLCIFHCKWHKKKQHDLISRNRKKVLINVGRRKNIAKWLRRFHVDFISVFVFWQLNHKMKREKF